MGPASDVFSFGVLAYELLTGQRPINGSGPGAIIAAIASGAHTPPAVRSELPGGVAAVVERCLEKDPEARFQSGNAVARALRRELSADEGPAIVEKRDSEDRPMTHARISSEQEIRFCTTADGVSLAYSAIGAGPIVVRVLGHFTHLEMEWEWPGHAPDPLRRVLPRSAGAARIRSRRGPRARNAHSQGLGKGDAGIPPGVREPILPQRCRPRTDRALNELQRVSADPETAARYHEACHRRGDGRDLFRQLRLPVLVVHGRDDLAVSAEEGRLLASIIPGSQLVLLPSGTHYFPTDTDVVMKATAAIDRFLLGSERRS